MKIEINNKNILLIIKEINKNETYRIGYSDELINNVIDIVDIFNGENLISFKLITRKEYRINTSWHYNMSMNTYQKYSYIINEKLREEKLRRILNE